MPKDLDEVIARVRRQTEKYMDTAYYDATDMRTVLDAAERWHKGYMRSWCMGCEKLKAMVQILRGELAQAQVVGGAQRGLGCDDTVVEDGITYRCDRARGHTGNCQRRYVGDDSARANGAALREPKP